MKYMWLICIGMLNAALVASEKEVSKKKLWLKNRDSSYVVGNHTYSQHALERKEERTITNKAISTAIYEGKCYRNPQRDDRYIHIDPKNKVAVVTSLDNHVITAMNCSSRNKLGLSNVLPIPRPHNTPVQPTQSHKFFKKKPYNDDLRIQLQDLDENFYDEKDYYSDEE